MKGQKLINSNVICPLIVMPYKNYEEKKEKARERYARIKANPEMHERYKAQTFEWRKENRDRVNASTKQLKSAKRQHLIDILGGKCVGCGVTENLQFDHIDRNNKSFTIGKNYGKRLELLEEEARKCQLLCKECHQLKSQINHDEKKLAEGYRVSSVEYLDDKILVTLSKSL